MFLPSRLALSLLLTASALAAQCPPGSYPPPPPPPPPGGAYPGPGDVSPPSPATPGPARPSPASPRGPTPATPGPVATPATTPAPAPAAGPTGPTTGGAGRPPVARPVAAQPGAGTTGRRWTAEDFKRGPTSKECLEIEWDLYVPEVATDRSQTAARMGALSREDAVARLRGDDDRPLLVLRDCSCGSHHGGLLQDDLGPESLRIMARWFHCVRLPEAARAPDHPLSALFADDAWHVLVDSASGQLVPVPSRPGELLRRMRSALEERFVVGGRDGFAAKLKEAGQLLNDFDRFDVEEVRGRDALDDEVDDHGDSRRARVLGDELAATLAERDRVLARWAGLGKLEAR